MKKKNTVLIFGIASILILSSVQIYIIKGIWQQKDQLFAITYTIHSQEALNSIRRSMTTDGFDTVRLLLDQYSGQAVRSLQAVKDTQELASRKKDIFDYFTKVISQEQDLSQLLSAYFESRGFDKNFKHRIIINDLEMIDNDTIVIYKKEGLLNQGRRSPFEITGSSILIREPHLEGNNYRLSFSYFIDFSDKNRQVWEETALSLAMAILSILIVVIIFMITYKNLMEERRLSNLKTDFINNMTHELKTPLSTITVAGKTLEMPQIRNDDSKILETAKLIGKQSLHLNQLINMILEISMWERTQFQLDKKTVDIEEVMNDVVDSFKNGGGNNSTISQKYDFKGAKIDLDVVYFTTLINNLLSNAVKYSDKVPEIEVEGFTQDDNIYIKVSDNGIGINKIDQKHVFDKFYRASTGNIHKFKGLGLGLYYVKKIAEAHNGDVEVTSRPGKGSTFTLMLPYES
ncbi:MAG TPA: HAMP domain-containing sensor histidine kinase [Bacteroidales bacterium]|nr:HAMP domain-containing sensor histidine kinase [Bacteroidales bacterium]